MSFKKGTKKIRGTIKSLFDEFKAFVNQGSVLDLAVGMIIGSAFTAIVTALVNNLLKPLINFIPINETGLQTVLRPAVTDATGNVLTEALIIDWGAIISAIITFFLTALILFVIVKAVNSAKDIGKRELGKLENMVAEKRAELEEDEEPEEEAPVVNADEVTAAIAPVESAETTDEVKELLREIRDLLKANEQK